MTFEEALATPGPLVAAWEGWRRQADRKLLLFSVEPTPTMLASTSVPDSGRDAMSNDLRKRGVRVGAYVPLKDLFWCADDQGFALWSWSRLLAHGNNGDLELADGRSVTGSQVRSVTSFVENEMIHRGVRLELADGSSVVVVDEQSSAAEGDPSYNRDNLSIDAAWAHYLGAALATWMGKPHVNQVP
jgi:hypothetical protein